MENKEPLRQVITKGETLTLKEFKEFTKNLPDDIEIMGYNVGFNDGYFVEVLSLTYKEGRLEIDLNNME